MSDSLELLAATTWFWLFSTGFIFAIHISIATLFCPAVWWLMIPLVAWIGYDRQTSERGGRPIEWVRKWTWWRLMKKYFNYKLITDGDGVAFDEEKNYILACFPHGMYPVGTFAAFVDGYQSIFPKHKVFQTVLNIQFWMPVIRELFLAIGGVSVSAPSIKYLLRKEKGGNAVSILIGGGDEAQYSQPGKYKIILKKRKGFVKMALQNGAPIVPVFTFGEVDVFEQLSFPGLGAIRSLVKSVTGVSLVLPVGKHVVCPNQVPVVTVVGKPINVEKVADPSNEEIEMLHEKFVNSLIQLFEDHKHKYVKDPSNTVLEIV